MGATALESNYLSDRSVDEETLFRDIHKHILRQAKSGGRIDTEAEIAERFNVTRYKVRKALSVLSQMGIVDRAPKRGMTVNALGPKNLSSQIQVQMDIANFDIREFIEARLLIEVNIIPLCVRRSSRSFPMRPMTLILFKLISIPPCFFCKSCSPVSSPSARQGAVAGCCKLVPKVS